MRACRAASQNGGFKLAGEVSQHENGIWRRLLRYILEYRSQPCRPPHRSRRGLLVYCNRLEPDGAPLPARICREHWSGIGNIRVSNLRRKPDDVAMSRKFRIFEVVLNKRRRAWKWHVRTSAGDIVMSGSELSRAAATYNAYRAFFLLLQSAPNRPSSPAGRARQASGRDRSRIHRQSGSDQNASTPPSN